MRILSTLKLVGLTRFELATSPTPRERATRLRYSPPRRVFYRRDTGSANQVRPFISFNLDLVYKPVKIVAECAKAETLRFMGP